MLQITAKTKNKYLFDGIQAIMKESVMILRRIRLTSWRLINFLFSIWLLYPTGKMKVILNVKMRNSNDELVW